MKFLIIDPPGSGLDIALRAKAAGHEVKLCVGPGKDRNPSPIGDGLVPKAQAWEPYMRWADLIFMTDNARWMWEIEPFHRKGFPIWGPSMVAAQWELDRGAGQEMMRACGMDVIEGESFHSYEKAEAFVREGMRRFVSKPNGDKDKSMSYVSKSPADMIYMLRRWARSAKKLQDEFVLQEFVSGIEVAVGGWFGPTGWIGDWCENFEHKKLGNDDTGPNTGEMGTALKYVGQSALAEQLLIPTTGMLHGLGYRGYVDVSAICDRKGRLRPLEWTMRPGWPLFCIQQAVHRGDPIEWMAAALQGRDILKTSKEVALGVVVAIPDFPYSNATGKEVEGVPLYGIDQSNFDSLHLCSVQAGVAPCMEEGEVVDKRIMVSAGDYLFVATGAASGVAAARERAYAALDEVEIPNSPIFRTDIGCRLEEELPALQSLGYMKEWKWD